MSMRMIHLCTAATLALSFSSFRAAAVPAGWNAFAEYDGTDSGGAAYAPGLDSDIDLFFGGAAPNTAGGTLDASRTLLSWGVKGSGVTNSQRTLPALAASNFLSGVTVKDYALAGIGFEVLLTADRTFAGGPVTTAGPGTQTTFPPYGSFAGLSTTGEEAWMDLSFAGGASVVNQAWTGLTGQWTGGGGLFGPRDSRAVDSYVTWAAGDIGVGDMLDILLHESVHSQGIMGGDPGASSPDLVIGPMKIVLYTTEDTSSGGGTNPIPAPATVALLGLGLTGLGAVRRRKSQ
jgi:hypothetical protein